MKKLLLTCTVVLAFSVASQAQSFVDLINTTNCPIQIELFAFDAACNFVSSTTYFVPVGGLVPAPQPGGFDWIIGNFQEAFCTLPGILIQAPIGAGCTFCSFGGIPPVNSGPSCSCGTINGIWDPCAATITFF